MEQMFNFPENQDINRKDVLTYLLGLGATFVIILLLLLGSSLSARAQQPQPKSLVFKATAPLTDHYSGYALLDAGSQSSALDSLAFPAREFKRAAYLTLSRHYLEVPLTAFTIKPFPANSSIQTRAELNYLLQLQHKRTAADVAQSNLMADVYYDPLTTNPEDADYSRNVNSLFFVGRTIGAWFSPQHLPLTTRVLQQVLQDATYYFFSLKVQFSRARPYQLEPGLHHLEAPGHASYPSGHASAAHVHAYLLSSLLPEHQEALMANAFDLAFSREVRGVHYPSDSEAGRVFARQFVALLLKSDKFQQDYAAMKKELIDAKKKHELLLRR